MSEVEKDKNQIPNTVNEPQVEYRKQEITFFNSFEEMNEHQYRHWINLNPEQRLAEHYALVTGVYDYKDSVSPSYDKIYFD